VTDGEISASVEVTPEPGGTVRYRVISAAAPETGAEPAEAAVDDGYVALMHQLG